jgi:hypothetical protein
MRKVLSVSALILAFVCSAHAGEIQNDFTGTPPQSSASAGIMQNDLTSTPQSSATATQQPTGGEIQNGVAGSLAQIALNVLAVLPSLH